MYCKSCGSYLEDSVKFCANCGAPVEGNAENAAYPEQFAYPKEPVGPQGPELGMKWFKFLIWFSLFFGALLNLVEGVMALTGGHYTMAGGDSEFIYDYYGNGLRVCDILYGLVIIGLAVFMIYTRFRLSGFRKNGPACLYIVYGGVAVCSLIYILLASAVVGENLLDANTVTSIVTSGVMIAVNVAYFNKRKHMFIY